MPRFLQDVRHAIRGLRRKRFVSSLAILAFTLGIGITIAVFSIFNGVILTPLPYPEADRIVSVYDTQPACSTCPASFPKYHDWKSRNEVFSAMGGSSPRYLVLSGDGAPERVTALTTTASLVDVFGVKPRLGRWYTEAEDQPGGPRVVVLAHPFWNGRLAADPGIVGRTLRFDGEPYEVIGVMPEGFAHRQGQVFIPLQKALDPATRGSHFLATYARLKPGVTPAQAASAMRTLGVSLAREFGHNHGIDVRSYYEVIVGNVRTPLKVLLGAVFLVLLIACSNVANLLLAAGLARRRELAIRLALGAGRKELARLLLAESLVLAGIGGALGLGLAQWAIQVFVALAGSQLPRASAIHLDARVVLFAAITSAAVGVFCGLWPITRMRLGELASAVREADTRTSSGGSSTFGSGLVVAEIAVAFALLVGAGLLVKNLALLQGRETGVRTTGVIAFDVAPSGPRYESDEQIVAFYRDLHQRLTRIPGVDSVGLTSHLPMYSYGMNGEMNIEGTPSWGPNDAPLVEYRFIVGDYLKSLDIKTLKGRSLDERDRQGTRTVLVNQAMADKFWPGQDPLGKRFGQGNDVSKWYEVVGVIGNIRSFGLAAATPLEFYQTIEQSPYRSMTVVLRSASGEPEKLIPAARQIVSSLDPLIPITAVQTMDSVVASSVGQPRLLTALSSLFGLVAGLLAMVGIYGVMAYNVRRQRQEFGIRLALGAREADVRRIVMVRGFRLAAVGVSLGLAGAFAVTRLLESMLNDVRPTDPTVFGLITFAVLVVTSLASVLPARQASRVDPIVVLREL
ncbi:MAG: ABC transporter permease [Vicinamibacteria bacterium]|nr:ABC transporter permease [Vicinamibacteria bacterium]